MDRRPIVIGVAGNPNVGKSAIFNALTGSRQHVGNWPGKTVERAEGRFYHQGREIHLVDLPGTYSLAAQSPEEVIARDYILSGEPDVVLNVVDATNLERNLNLTLQILEITDRVVVALNLMDEVKRQGQEIDVAKLEADLGVPVVPTVATEGQGLPEMIEAVIAVADGRTQNDPVSVDYGVTIEGYIERLREDIARVCECGRSRWLALKLLEDDPWGAPYACGRVSALTQRRRSFAAAMGSHMTSCTASSAVHEPRMTVSPNGLIGLLPTSFGPGLSRWQFSRSSFGSPSRGAKSLAGG